MCSPQGSDIHYATLAALLLLTADSFFTVRLLRRSGNIDLLGLKNLWQELHRV